MNTVLKIGAMGALASLAGIGVLAQNQNSSATRFVMGETGKIFGAPARSWAKLAGDGSVLEAGFTLSYDSVARATFPKADPNMKMDSPAAMPPPLVELNFPKEVQDTTFFDHLDVYWNPVGHPPVYGVPHFDMHFFTINKAAVASIDCKDLSQADPSLLAKGYVPTVPPNATPDKVCIPRMGFHSLPAGDLGLKPGEFSKTMMAVYYGGKLNAIEPMISRDALLEKKSFSLNVPQLASLGRATRYPGKFEARFDAKASTYNLIFSDFVGTQK